MYKIPVWKMILEAVDAHKMETITNGDIHKFILTKYGDVNIATINAQIGACCVNRQSRVYMPMNEKPRIATGPYDFLFCVERGVFTKYDSKKHGIWEIATISGNLIVKRTDGEKQRPQSTSNLEQKRNHQKRVIRQDIKRPTADIIKEYLDTWETLDKYKKQEDALNKLFRDLCPENQCLDDILLKVAVLNTFYSTNVFNIARLAEHIQTLEVDERLRQGDITLVTDISKGHGIKNTSNGKEICFYSFATKYCSHHQPDIFPIFDNYVGDLLVYYSNLDGFANFTRGQLRDITIFHKALLSMQMYYSLEAFSLKEIDRFLWQYGKECFPKKFKTKKQ